MNPSQPEGLGGQATPRVTPRTSAVLVDEESRWQRHPRDLIAAILMFIAIGVVMLLAVYASSTTLAVTRDVRTATNDILETIVFMPVNVLEGLIGFFLPFILLIDIAWHRRWRALATAATAVASAVFIAYSLLWLFERYFPLSPLTGQLSDSLSEQSYIRLLPYVSIISAILTVASAGQKTKTARWGWPLLSVVLVLSVLRGNQTLPGALITAFLGSMCGLVARYVIGDIPNHTNGIDLVRLIRRAGVDARLIVRIDELAEDAPVKAWTASTRSSLGHVDRYGIEQIHEILRRAGKTPESSSPEAASPGSSGASGTSGTSGSSGALAPEGLPLEAPTSGGEVHQGEAQASDAKAGQADSGEASNGDANAADRTEQQQTPGRSPSQQANPDHTNHNRTNPDRKPGQAQPAQTPTSHLFPAPDVDPQLLREETIKRYHPPVGEQASRNYIIIDADGNAHHAMLLDADQQIVGFIASMWSRMVLTTTAKHAETTIEATADRLTLMELAVKSCDLAPDRRIKVAGSDRSMAVLLRVVGSRALDELEADEIPDSALDEVWDVLRRAHYRGLSHGNVHSGTTALRDGHIELCHWGNGSIAASEMERRIDMAQAMAMMATTVGVERAVASANRCLPADQVVSLAPVLQKAIIPFHTRARFADRHSLEALRDRLTEHVPEVGEVTPTQIYRFSPRTVITATIGLVAVYLLLGSVNFAELRETLAKANPAWMIFAFGIALFTYLGAAITLQAYTAEKFPLRSGVLVQVAASVVTLVAPAGIGPAALNLRFLQKRRIPTPIALATVSLVQVAQFATTIVFLVILSLATGEVGTLSLPSGSVLLGIAAVVLVLAAAFLIKPLRLWAVERARPTVDQVWPRLVWLATHPRRLLYGFGGSFIQIIAFVACFGGCLAAFGYPLPIVTLAVTYLVSNSVGSIVPSPGGIGPVEAALTGGLTLAGVPYSVAFSTAILYRLFTFWGRVPLGWFALRYLTKHEVI